MFQQIISRPSSLTRHRMSPLADERIGYLRHRADQGLSKRTLRGDATYLLAITRLLRLADRPGAAISIEEVNKAAKRWASRVPPLKVHRPGRISESMFRSIAIRWLEFLGRLQPPPVSRFDPWLLDFDAYMRVERGLSDVTRKGRCWTIHHCLKHLNIGDSLSDITVADIDALLKFFADRHGYGRKTLQKVAGDLRAFIRFGASRGWFRKDFSEAIRSPRVYSMDSLPLGPSWHDVRRLLELTEGDNPRNVRDRAIIMLFATYGLRVGEVRRLRLEDFDWERELLSVRSAKTRRNRLFPLSPPVGEAVLRYITQVRPRTGHREVFLTMARPIRPVQSLHSIVALRLRRLGVNCTHVGPHALRHACASHLLAQGLSLKQIGDQLGHVDPDTTRIYAKVDIAALRQVANFDLGDVL